MGFKGRGCANGSHEQVRQLLALTGAGSVNGYGMEARGQARHGVKRQVTHLEGVVGKGPGQAGVAVLQGLPSYK